MNNTYQLIDKYGNILNMDSGHFTVTNLGAVGNQDTNYTQQTAYYQDGATVTAINALPRALSITIMINTMDNEYRVYEYTIREQLFNFLSAYVAPLTLREYRVDGTMRELRNVYPNSGVIMDRGSGNGAQWQEVINLTAFDPIWYGSSNTISAISTVDNNLVFPITFPIQFGSTGYFLSTGSITNSGNWIVYPKITITAPYNTFTLTNTTTGAVITLYVAIASGGRIIDLTSPTTGFTVTDLNGVNKINELTIDSNLTEFYIAPKANTIITGSAISGSGSTSLTVEYTARYTGI